jgi:Flp pilus assembly protein TadG
VSAQAEIHRGHAVVEMAIVLPILGVLVLSIWQFGVVYDTWQNLNSAAVSGVRAAASAPAGSELSAGEAAADQAAAGSLELDSFTIDKTTVKGIASLRATACTSYHANLLGITLKRGQFCRQATMPVA